MSLNISESMLRLIPELQATVDMNRLGPRQYKAFERFVRTGIINVSTVHSEFASKLRTKHGLPVIHTGSRRLHWQGLTDRQLEEFHEKVTAAALAWKIEHPDDRGNAYINGKWMREQGEHRADTFEKAVKQAGGKGGLWYGVNPIVAKVVSKMELPKFEGDIPKIFTVDMKNDPSNFTTT